MRLLEAKGFVVALVARPSEAVHDPQMRENGVIVPLQGGGHTVSSPLWIAGIEKAVATPAPKIGEHGAAIFGSAASLRSRLRNSAPKAS